MNLRSFLILTIILSTILMGLSIWNKISSPPISKIDHKITIPTNPISQQPKIPDLVFKINEKNSKIKSLQCDDMDVYIWQNGIRIRLTGEIYYDKSDNFRMFVNSILGKELDLGSNKDVFWYWSRRNDREGLYYARYEDFFSTRLKTPFNPIFLRTSFGIDTLPTENVNFAENDNGLLVITKSKNSTGQTINKYTFINKKTELIEGYLIAYENGTKSASAEILEYQNGLPKNILFHYYEEDKIMRFDLRNNTINSFIDNEKFSMPNIKPQINMGEVIQYNN